MKTRLNPRMKATEFSITLRNSCDWCDFNSSTPAPEMSDTYPGTSGNTQGERKETRPAKKAAMGSGNVDIEVYCTCSVRRTRANKCTREANRSFVKAAREPSSRKAESTGRSGSLAAFPQHRAQPRSCARTGAGLSPSPGRNLRLGGCRFGAGRKCFRTSELVRRLRNRFAQEAGRDHGAEHRAVALLFDLQAVKKLLYIRVGPLTAHGNFRGMKQAEIGSHLIGQALGVFPAVGKCVRAKMHAAQVADGGQHHRRLGKKKRQVEGASRRLPVGIELENGPADAGQGNLAVVLPQKLRPAER